MFSFPAVLLLATVPAVGSIAPDFEVTDTEGHSYHLAELIKEDTVVLAFFPKAFTSGCTHEMSAYRDRYKELESAHGKLLAVSMDDLATLKKFKDSLKAPFSFVPDPDGKLVALYDVKMPLVHLAHRYTFVIGPERKILRVDSGKDAVDPEAAVQACPRRQQPSNSNH